MDDIAIRVENVSKTFKIIKPRGISGLLMKTDPEKYRTFLALNGISFTVKKGEVLGIIGLNGHFQKIPNPEDYIAIGNVSDENDRYSKIPHVSYEFRIPIDVLGRSDNYGFYMAVFEANSNVIYSWPTEVQQNRIFTIPSPSVWGEIISPDKSMGRS